MTQEEFEGILSSVRSAPSESLESDVVEFKEFRDAAALHNSKDLSDELVAFANYRGGTVIVGVRDSSNVKHGAWAEQLVGFPNADVIEVKERLSGRVTPRIPIGVAQFEFDGKSYLAISVQKWRDGLVATTSGKVYVRDGRSSRPMTPLEIEQAVKALPNYDWSSEEVSLSTNEALDPTLVEDARARFAELRKLKELTTAGFLEAVGVTKNGVLTKGGLLFLGRAQVIESHIGCFEFRFSWKNKVGDLIINDVWNGCLWEAISKSRRHFEACNSFREFSWQGVRHLVPILDSVAFHEAYLNALVHRDYAKDGMVAVDYHGDRMCIASPGEFYGGVTADNIFKHQPRHRNKALARILMAFNLVDRAGMGVRRMSQRSLMYGRKFPEFHDRNGVIEVVMDAEFMRAPIFLISQNEKDNYGVAELLVLNSVFGREGAPVEELEAQLEVLSDDPWAELCRIVSSVRYIEFCATREAVLVRVKNKFSEFFEVSKEARPPRVSDKLVALYCYLRKHGSASNSDLCAVLGYAHSSQTSGFLKKTEFVAREGEGPAAVWRLAGRPPHVLRRRALDKIVTGGGATNISPRLADVA